MELTEERYQHLRAIAAKKVSQCPGLTLDRFLRALGYNIPKAKHCLTRWDSIARFRKDLLLRLRCDRIIEFQKDYPLMDGCPFTVYPWGKLPEQILIDGRKKVKSEARLRESAPPPKMQRLFPAQKRLIPLVFDVLLEAEDNQWFLTWDLEDSLKKEGFTEGVEDSRIIQDLTVATQTLYGLGLIQKRKLGLKIQVAKAPEYLPELGDRVVENPLRESQRFGTILEMQPYQNTWKLLVEWDDSTRSLSSPDLCFKVENEDFWHQWDAAINKPKKPTKADLFPRGTAVKKLYIQSEKIGFVISQEPRKSGDRVLVNVRWNDKTTGFVDVRKLQPIDLANTAIAS